MKVAETYHGKPCKKAGHTERYVSNGKCIDCHKASSIKHYAENTEECKAHDKIYAAKNRGLKTHHQALRRAMILQQTPSWADLDKIKEIFITCPDGYEVDHIHPLIKGGLHVHYNLQHLTIHDNRVKSDKL